MATFLNERMVGDEIILEGKTDYYTINYYVAYQQQQEALPCLELVFHHHSQYVYDSENKTLDTRRRNTIVFPFSTFVLCPNLFLLAKFLGRKTKVVVASVLVVSCSCFWRSNRSEFIYRRPTVWLLFFSLILPEWFLVSTQSVAINDASETCLVWVRYF